MHTRTAYLPTLFGFALGALAMHACASPLAGLAEAKPAPSEATPAALQPPEALVPPPPAETPIPSVQLPRNEGAPLPLHRA